MNASLDVQPKRLNPGISGVLLLPLTEQDAQILRTLEVIRRTRGWGVTSTAWML